MASPRPDPWMVATFLPRRKGVNSRCRSDSRMPVRRSCPRNKASPPPREPDANLVSDHGDKVILEPVQLCFLSKLLVDPGRGGGDLLHETAIQCQDFCIALQDVFASQLRFVAQPGLGREEKIKQQAQPA